MLVVVGGHTRNIGKTTVACGIIEALRDWNWTAIKITQYGHGVCSRNGEPCPCADPTHPVSISEEEGDFPTTDSGRFLVSGAQRAFWVRTPAGGLNDAMPRLRKILDGGENIIVESNSLLRFVKPDFYAVVVDGAVADFKPPRSTVGGVTIRQRNQNVKCVLVQWQEPFGLHKANSIMCRYSASRKTAARSH